MKHLSEDELVLQHYGESGDRASKEHLEACRECRQAYEQLKQVLGAVSAVPVPERSERYPNEVWQRVQAAARERERKRWDWSLLFRPPLLAVAASVAVLVVGAFIFGRFGPGGPAAPGPISSEVRERILLVAVGDHLERSQSLLVELTHTEGKGLLDIGRQQARAEELASNNRIFLQTASRSGDPAIVELLDELERLLLEIANGPSNLAPAALNDLRERIARRGILFKIQVIGDKARQQGEAAGQSSPVPSRT